MPSKATEFATSFWGTSQERMGKEMRHWAMSSRCRWRCTNWQVCGADVTIKALTVENCSAIVVVTMQAELLGLYCSFGNAQQAFGWMKQLLVTMGVRVHACAVCPMFTRTKIYTQKAKSVARERNKPRLPTDKWLRWIVLPLRTQQAYNAALVSV